jgi:hypothetical protein
LQLLWDPLLIGAWQTSHSACHHWSKQLEPIAFSSEMGNGSRHGRWGRRLPGSAPRSGGLCEPLAPANQLKRSCRQWGTCEPAWPTQHPR